MHLILFHRGFIPHRPNVSAKDPNLLDRNGPFRRLMRATLENWKRRKKGAAPHGLDDHRHGGIGLQRRQLKRFADRLCGVDARISATEGAPGEWDRGQSRLMGRF